MLRRTHDSLAAALVALILAMATPVFGETAPVDLNSATAAQLIELKGVGPAKARAIIEHRDKHGQFKTVDDLRLVHGIGDKLLEQLRPQVTVEGGAAAPAAAAQP